MKWKNFVRLLRNNPDLETAPLLSIVHAPPNWIAKSNFRYKELIEVFEGMVGFVRVRPFVPQVLVQQLGEKETSELFLQWSYFVLHRIEYPNGGPQLDESRPVGNGTTVMDCIKNVQFAHSEFTSRSKLAWTFVVKRTISTQKVTDKESRSYDIYRLPEDFQIPA